jgi:cell division protein FtsN
VKSQTIVDFSEAFPNRNKQLVGFALGIVAIFIVGFAVLFSSGSGESGAESANSSENAATVEEPSTPEQPAPASSEPAAQKPEPKAEPEQGAALAARVTVMVESEPTGAEVRRNGILLGKTPMEINPERGQPPFKLNFELAGYSSVEETVNPLEATEVRALLTPQAKTKPPRARKVRRTPRPESETPGSQPRNKIDTMLD